MSIASKQLLPWTVALAIVVSPLAAWGQRPTKRWSTDALFYLSTDNMHALSQSWQVTTPGKASVSADFTTYRQALAREGVGAISNLRPWIGVDWEELAPVKDRVVMALVPAEKQQHGVVVWIAGDPDSVALQNCAQAATKYWKGNKYKTSSEQQGKVTVQRFERQLPDGHKSERWLAAGAQGLLITTHSFNFEGLCAELLAEPKHDAPAQGATATVALKPFSLAQYIAPPKATKQRDWLVLAQRLGAKPLDQIQGTVHIAPSKETALSVEFNIPLTVPLVQATRLLDMPVGEQRDPLPLAIEGLDTMSNWRWEFRTAMSAFGNLFDELVEPGPDGVGLFEDLLAGLREDPEGPQIDLRREVFDRIGPRMVAYGAIPKAKSSQRQLIYCAECTAENNGRVQAALEGFFKNDRGVKAQKIAEHHTWSVAPGKTLFVEVESTDLIAFRSVAIGPLGFLIATDPQILDAALTQTPKPVEANIQLWNTLIKASTQSEDKNRGARVLLDTARRFTPAYNVAIATNGELGSGDSALLRWLVLGDEVDARRFKPGDLPTNDTMRGFLQPLWLVYQPQKRNLLLRAGMLASPTAEAPK